MNRFFGFFIAAAFIFSAAFISGCVKDGTDGKDGTNGAQGQQGQQGADGKNSYLVIFDSDGGTPMFSLNGVKHGDKVTAPPDPKKYFGTYELDFFGWFAPSAATAFDFNTPITDNITLTAKWVVPRLLFYGTWTNIDDVAGWGEDCTIILTETTWNEGGLSFEINVWTARSNGSAATKDDYPNGYYVKGEYDWYLYMHKTDPDKLLVFFDGDGNYGNSYNIFTRQP